MLPSTDFALSPADALAGVDPFQIAQATTIDAGGDLVGVVEATSRFSRFCRGSPLSTPGTGFTASRWPAAKLQSRMVRMRRIVRREVSGLSVQMGARTRSTSACRIA